MSSWKNLVARWGSGAGETDDVRIDASTNSLQVVQYEHHEIHANDHYFVEDFTTLDNTDTADFVIEADSTQKVPHLELAFQATGLMTLDVYFGITYTAGSGTLIVPVANNQNKCYSGSHTAAASSATVMTDSAASFTVDALIGWKIYNITDGSYGVVTDNDATTVTVASLTGGTDNDWDQNDVYTINQSLAKVELDPTITDTGTRRFGLSGGDASNPNRGVPGGVSREDEIVLRSGVAYLFRFTSGVNDNILAYKGLWYEHEDEN